VLLATLGSVGIPLEGLAFIAGVDRILDPPPLSSTLAHRETH
jgi:Na+/H+-dicarboxylate symporter